MDLEHEDTGESIEQLAQRLIQNWEKTAAVAVAIILLLNVILGSWYIVDKDEEATVRRFGEYIKTEGPGFHLKFPFFIDRITTTSVTTVHRIEIGFRTTEVNDDKPKYATVLQEAEMLTGDDNIAIIDFVVQYRSSDAFKWQFMVKDPVRVLNLMSQAAMRLVVGRSLFDKVATVGKIAVQVEVAEILQAYVDEIDMGGQIVSVQLQDVQPPEPVVEAFKDVVTAREERETAIQIARRHANQVLPEARGEAAEILNIAEGYAAARVAAANGDVSRFTQVLAKYLAAPKVTAQRLMFETQERVLRGKDITVDSSEGGILKLLNLTSGGTPLNTAK